MEIFDDTDSSSSKFQNVLDYSKEKYPSENFCILKENRFNILYLQDFDQQGVHKTETHTIFYFGFIKNKKEIYDLIINNNNDLESELVPNSNDADLVNALYLTFGDKGFNFINGLFSCIIWNKKKNLLKVFIDRFGINFCYFSNQSNNLVGSSSLDMLLSTGISRELSIEAIDDYLSYRITQPPLTIFRDINKVPQGHFLQFSDEIEIVSYFDFDMDITPSKDDSFYIRRFTEDFTRSVQDSLEIPESCYTLSGGVDSSLIVKLAKENSIDQVNTFTLSLGKENDNYHDEFFAKQVSEKLDTNHKTIYLLPEDIKDEKFFNFCMNVIDEPTVNSYPNEIKLNKEISKDFKCTVYGSMAAAAYFEGYYWKDALKEKKYLLSFLYSFLLSICLSFKVFKGRMTIARKIYLRLVAFLKERSYSKDQKIEETNRLYTDNFKQEIYSPFFLNQLSTKAKTKAVNLFNSLNFKTDANKAMYTEYYCLSLARNSLFNSMSHNFMHMFYYPYLDTKFANHNLETPTHLKLEKKIAKLAFNSHDLQPSFERKREGLALAYEWLGDELKDDVEDILFNQKHPLDKLFNQSAIKFMLDAHNKKHDFGAYLWALVTLKKWSIHKGATLTNLD